jgi:tRNA nucleotidyltransferase (CCA-adding enzyme)
MKNVPPTKILRYTALLHDSGKPECRVTDSNGVDHFKGHNAFSEKVAERVLRRLKMDNDTIRDVKKLVYWHDFGLKGDMKISRFRKGLSEMGLRYFDDYIYIRRADIAGQSDYAREESLETLKKMIEMKQRVVENGDCLSIAELKIKGGDLKEIGIEPGPKMGEILKMLLREVLGTPSMNEKEALIKRASQLKDEI